MSELIDNTQKKKETLKTLIRELHAGGKAGDVQARVRELMGDVPYGLVMEAEQELISEGISTEEVLDMCDLHAEVLKGNLSHDGARTSPPGHPVHTFSAENLAIAELLDRIAPLIDALDGVSGPAELAEALMRIRIAFNELMDVDKHYRRKENLLFPFLEKYGITGPPTVMWGKHDQIREQLRAAFAVLGNPAGTTVANAFDVADLVLRPVLKNVREMIFKEEEILFPMCLDRLTDVEWYEIVVQSPEIGFCLIDPVDAWRPADVPLPAEQRQEGGRINLPSGSFTAQELTALLNTLPVDLTFVDANDAVRYFTQGRERIFDRNRAILGRKVQMCHPPHSVHIVEKIVGDFRSGRQDRAAFWIELHGKFIHIEYFAVRDEQGAYLGTLEVSQDLTAKRALTGERRLLTYDGGEEVSTPAASAPPANAPAWLSASAVALRYDARADLAAGVHPAQRVMVELARLKTGEAFELVTPFPPMPLVDKAREAGYAAWSHAESADCVKTWFGRA
jgi:DUF438 domain-containing protein